MPQVLVPFTTGVEEIELVAVVDILRRAEVDVCLASLDGDAVLGRSRISIAADSALADTLGQHWDMIVLPGGLPNAHLLRDNPLIKVLLQQQAEQQRYIAAICAAPTILAAYGMTKGCRVTAYPTCEAEMQALAPTSHYQHDDVVNDGLLITSRGAGTAIAFALTLVETLCGVAKASEVGVSIVASPHLPCTATRHS